MEIEFSNQVLNKHFVVTVDGFKLNSREESQLEDNGALVVDFGGTFDDEDSIQFTLPTREVRLPEGSPITTKFSVDELTAPVAAEQSKFYISAMQTKIQEALDLWMSFDYASHESKSVITLTAS